MMTSFQRVHDKLYNVKNRYKFDSKIVIITRFPNSQSGFPSPPSTPTGKRETRYFYDKSTYSSSFIITQSLYLYTYICVHSKISPFEHAYGYNAIFSVYVVYYQPYDIFYSSGKSFENVARLSRRH